MQPEEITDNDTLRAWLNARPEAIRQRDAIWIASRTAARVFPLHGRDTRNFGHAQIANAGDLTAFPVLRCLLLSGIAALSPTPEVQNAAYSGAATAAYSDAAIAAYPKGYPSAYSAAYSAAFSAAYPAASSAKSANSAANSAADAAADATASVAFSADAVWDQIRNDAGLVSVAVLEQNRPLWDRPPPDWFTQADAETRAIWQADPPGTWDFWIRWWDGLLSGHPVNWNLQEKIVLIPDDIWNAGAEQVAEAIRRIEQEFALVATENGEVLVQNPDTGQIYLQPISHLPDDLDTRTRRALERLSRLFSHDASNQYRALAPDLAMLVEIAADTTTGPVELFDACASASRRLRNRIASGECPEAAKDALIEDYGLRLVDIAADIFSNDQTTQDTIHKRNAVKGNTALVDGRDALQTAVQLARPVVEGRLEIALKVDVDIATNPKADPEERKDASLRLSGRLLRIGGIAVAVAGGAAGAVIGFADLLEAFGKIAADPKMQHAISYIMRFLNL